MFVSLFAFQIKLIQQKEILSFGSLEKKSFGISLLVRIIMSSSKKVFS